MASAWLPCCTNSVEALTVVPAPHPQTPRPRLPAPKPLSPFQAAATLQRRQEVPSPKDPLCLFAPDPQYSFTQADLKPHASPGVSECEPLGSNVFCLQARTLPQRMSLPPTWNAGRWPQQQMATYGRLAAPATQSMMGANLAPTMLLAPSSPTSHGEQESTHESEPCFDGLCLNEARESEEVTGEYVYWGYDFKPALPPALGVSVVLGAICTAIVQIPLLCRLQSWSQAEAPLIALEVGLAAVTVVLMGYCSLGDPGQLKKMRNVPLDRIDLEQGDRPFRAHKSWQYRRKIRRYDHYCKWVNNVIGLLNHREFVLMLVGLCLIGLFGVILDGYLALLLAKKGLWEAEIAVVLHLAFSVVLLAIEVPIFQTHIGLVSRNELAEEWKNNLNYVANQTSMGDGIPVEDLDDEEYNQLFDAKAFVYDKSRNRWDQGCSSNCWNFWCWPRWPAGELGEF